MTERRDDARRRVCFGGQIEAAAFLPDTPCMVRDVSLTGARIRVSPDAILPERLVLHVPMRRECRLARVVWRDGDMVGLRFEERTDRPEGAATSESRPQSPPFVPAPGRDTLH
jgi:hypothetical protein